MTRIRPEGGLTGTYATPTIAAASGVWSMRDYERNLRLNTWPLDTGSADPYFNRNGILIHADGSTDANNNVIIDSSSSYAIPFAGTKSVYFSGATDQISFPSTANLAPGTGDFTVEFWMLLNSSSSTAPGNIFNTNVTGGLSVYVVNTAIQIARYNTGADLTVNYTWSIGTWYHIACTRLSGTGYIFINGSLAGSGAVTSNYTQAGALVGGGGVTAGYVSNLRYVVGTCLYSAPFQVPSSPLTAVANTRLLTCQSSTIVDNSTNALTPTLSGSPTVSSGNYPLALTRTSNPGQGTFSPFSSPAGYWSNYFSGNSTTKDYLTSTNISIGTGDFCVEAWVFLTINQASCIFCSSLRFTINTATNIKVINNGVADIINYTGVSTSLLGRWAHVAVTRQGTSMRLFIDGALATTVTDSTNFASATTRIGTEAGSLIEPFAGHISNLRVVTGSAVYTAAFTPTQVPLTAISGTQLLTCQSNRFIDNSPVNNTITPTNSAMTSPSSPFAPTGTYDGPSEGGSIYLNGTSDYFRIGTAQAALGLGTGDWTLEYWVYFNSVASGCGIVDLRTSAGGASQNKPTTYISAANTLSFYAAGAVRISQTVSSGQWYHVAIVKSSNVTKFYLNGIASGTTYSDTLDYTTSSQMTVGSYGDSVGSGFMPGYISDIRVTKSALYNANFTPPSVPLTTSTSPSLLLNATNASIIDQTGKCVISTLSGAKISTSVTKFGTGSIVFNGTTDYLSLTGYNSTAANIAALQFGAADFTVEGWFYSQGSASNQTIFQLNGFNTAWAAARLDITTSNTLQLLCSVTGAAWAINYTTPTSITLNQFNHIAVVRSGSNFYIFVNGAQVGVTQTNSSALMQGSGYNWIGALANSTAQNFFKGYIDEFRISRYARYTSNFTPATQAFLDR